MTTANHARDMSAIILAGILEDSLNGRPPVSVLLKPQCVFVPEGEHPTAATACFLVTAGAEVLSVQMAFAFFGEYDECRGVVSAMILQHRISGERLTYPADIERDGDRLHAAVNALLEREYGQYFVSLRRLRALSREIHR